MRTVAAGEEGEAGRGGEGEGGINGGGKEEGRSTIKHARYKRKERGRRGR